MEPAAPGTEDDVTPLPSSDLSKEQENEEDRLLSLKVRFPNGKRGNVFEFSFQNGAAHWYCNVCACPVIGRVYHHDIGKHHTTNMQMGNYLRNAKTLNVNPAIQIPPGQSVPPVFERTIEKTAQIQDTLDNFTIGPIIGLEYLLELQEFGKDIDPSYLCMLCNKKGTPRTVIAHLISYNHIKQYLQRHFITCSRMLLPYNAPQYKRNWQSIIEKLSAAIEIKFGRLKPHVVDKTNFLKSPAFYQHMIASGPHFNESNGVTFEELIVKAEFTKTMDETSIVKPSQNVTKRTYRQSGMDQTFNDSEKAKHSSSPPVVGIPKEPRAVPATAKRRSSLSSVSSVSSDFESSQKEPFDNLVREEKRQKYCSPAVSFNKNRDHFKFQKRVQRSRSRSASPRRDRHLMPWQRSNYIRSRSDNVVVDPNKQKNDKMEEFKKLAAAIENDMDRTLKQHEKNPEKHPQYSEEWKKFWNIRYKELAAEGKNVSSYDFKPEWIKFWNIRMLEFHANEVKMKIDALRKRLGLPEEPEPARFKITNKKVSSQEEDDKRVPSMDPDIIVIEDKDEETVCLNQRSPSPWETESKKPTQSFKSKTRTRVILKASPPRARSRERLRERSREPIRARSRERIRARSRERIHEKSRERIRERSRDCSLRERSRERPIGKLQYGHERSCSRFSRDRSHERSYQKCNYVGRSRSRSRERGGCYTKSKEYESKEFSRDKIYYRESQLPEYLKYPHISRDVTRNSVHSSLIESHSLTMEVDVPIDDNEEVNIIGVLRLLTALEDKLGSLGPKVIDLLSQALALEKNEANSSESLLDNEVNCVMFETVKEKLKGELSTGLGNYSQEKACNHAVKKITSLMYYASQRSKEKKKSFQDNPIQVPGMGTVDKTAIGKMIATALVNQGKTDVTQGQLEELVSAVVGMAEASRNSNKPITTASFLQQLTEATIAESKCKPPTELLETVLQETKPESNTNMEHLSDEDLQMLLQNFKDLCTEEQHSLISYLKELEAKAPEKVERLRKFVNLESNVVSSSDNVTVEQFPKNVIETEVAGQSSPFSSRFAGQNPTEEKSFDNDDAEDERKETIEKKEEAVKILLDSEDEDYSYEDVFKVAKQNVTEKEEKNRKTADAASSIVFKTEDFDLSNAKSLIANIMGQFKENNGVATTEASTSLEGLSSGIEKNENSLEMITQNIDNYTINLDNLASAVKISQHAKPSLNDFNAPNCANVNQSCSDITLNLDIPPICQNITQIQTHIADPPTNLIQHQNRPSHDMHPNKIQPIPNPYSTNNHNILQQNRNMSPFNHEAPPICNAPPNHNRSLNQSVPFSFGNNYTPNPSFQQNNPFIRHPNSHFRGRNRNNRFDYYENQNPMGNRPRPGSYNNNYGPRW